MSDEEKHEIKPDIEDGLIVQPGERGGMPGIVAMLGELKPGSIVTEEGVANLFHRHASSVKRAVQRGELPPPTRIFGQQAWTAGAIVRHIEGRLEESARERKRMDLRLEKLSP